MIATLKDFKHRNFPSWAFDFLQFLEDHETECESYYTDHNLGTFYWIKYHLADVAAVPGNFVAVGDAVMKLNSFGGQLRSPKKLPLC